MLRRGPRERFREVGSCRQVGSSGKVDSSRLVGNVVGQAQRRYAAEAPLSVDRALNDRLAATARASFLRGGRSLVARDRVNSTVSLASQARRKHHHAGGRRIVSTWQTTRIQKCVLRESRQRFSCNARLWRVVPIRVIRHTRRNIPIDHWAHRRRCSGSHGARESPNNEAGKVQHRAHRTLPPSSLDYNTPGLSVRAPLAARA